MQSEVIPSSSDLDFMNEIILSKVTKLAKAQADADLEIGISVPGIVDQRTGQTVFVPFFQWSDWDIGSRLRDATGLPVVIDNSANAVALAELWYGSNEIRRTRNFVEVLVAEGIGTGIIIDGQIYRGESGAAGEFGHMFVGKGAPVMCSCGRDDCWEAHASEKAILHRYCSGNGAGPGVNIERFVSLAQNGEKRALAVMNETAKYLGIGISNLIVGLSPQTIVISGRIVRAWDLISETIQELALRSIRHELSRTTIVPSALGDNPTIMGSISLVLSRKFASANLICFFVLRLEVLTLQNGCIKTLFD